MLTSYQSQSGVKSLESIVRRSNNCCCGGGMFSVGEGFYTCPILGLPALQLVAIENCNKAACPSIENPHM